MKYIAHLVQKGEGCDYTIGCGLVVHELSADNMEDAKQELKELIKEDYSYSEAYLEKATLYEVKEEVNIEVEKIYNEKEEEKLSKADKEQRIKDYEKFLELKKKFEDE